MTKLYEIRNDLLGLQHLIDDGEMDAQTLSDTLEGVMCEFNDKAQGLLAVMANIGSDVASVDEEIKRLQSRKRTMTNHQTWMKDYLRDNMAASGITKISSPLFSVTLKKPGVIVNVTDEKLIPDDYWVEVPATRRLDKKLLLTALKSGGIPGAELGEAKQGLLIK